MASQSATAAADFESGRTVSSLTAIQLRPFDEYELTVAKAGYRSASLYLGEVPLSRMTAWDFFPGSLIATRLLSWTVMAWWHRATRPRRIVLRPLEGASSSKRVVVRVSLQSTSTEASLSLTPDEPVEIRVVKKA